MPRWLILFFRIMLSHNISLRTLVSHMNDETFLLGGHWFLRTQFKELPLGFDEQKILFATTLSSNETSWHHNIPHKKINSCPFNKTPMLYCYFYKLSFTKTKFLSKLCLMLTNHNINALNPNHCSWESSWRTEICGSHWSSRLFLPTSQEMGE
jgi:hypothetical protein